MKLYGALLMIRLFPRIVFEVVPSVRTLASHLTTLIPVRNAKYTTFLRAASVFGTQSRNDLDSRLRQIPDGAVFDKDENAVQR